MTIIVHEVSFKEAYLESKNKTFLLQNLMAQILGFSLDEETSGSWILNSVSKDIITV